jgi:uncharacterized protein (TIGR00297 family)
MIQIEIAAIASLGIVSLAYALGALTPSGAFAAFAIGTVTFGVDGWPAAAVLLAFFITSSLLSRLGSRRKRRLIDFGKQGPRDAWQVFANGGVAGVCIALSRTTDVPLALAFAGAIAAATADTWSSEIGSLAQRGVRSILTFRPVQSGLSGGISLPGTIAQCAGAAFIALVAYDVHLAPFWPVAIGGVAGSLFDSILGASAQALHWCPTCARPCETEIHSCGTQTKMFRGLRWFDNDLVNLLATFCGAAVALLVASHWPDLW